MPPSSMELALTALISSKKYSVVNGLNLKGFIIANLIHTKIINPLNWAQQQV